MQMKLCQIFGKKKITLKLRGYVGIFLNIDQVVQSDCYTYNVYHILSLQEFKQFKEVRGRPSP